MIAEHDEEPNNPESDRLQRNKQFWRQMEMFMEKIFQQEKGGNVQDKNKRVSLEEKHSRRM
eukprot:3686695-Karenia_brevis.AAC.1